jgi:hypothetical protein
MPGSIRAVQAFHGLPGYYRQFIKDYRAITTPLTCLLCKNGFVWGLATEAAFPQALACLNNGTHLVAPRFRATVRGGV